MRNGLEITRAAEGLMIRVPEDFGGSQPSQEWAESVMTEWPTEAGMVTIDLSRSKAVASAFLAQLLVLRREVSARGGVVILDRPNDRFRRVLYYMGVSHLFRVIPEGAQPGAVDAAPG
jgi:ABC-type transporter Mla MlaB component